MKTFAAALTALCVLFTAATASAALPPPDQYLKTTVDEVSRIVKSQSGKGDIVLDKQLKEKLYPLFDWDEMSRLALGANWGKATPDEQKQFKELFSELLSRTYLKRIKSNVVESKLEIIDAKVEGEKALVKTRVQANGEPVSIDYRLRAEGSAWKAYDVVIENVGLISNYRAEFGDIVQKDGMQGLLGKLREKEEAKK